jgi:hypothetical protein
MFALIAIGVTVGLWLLGLLYCPQGLRAYQTGVSASIGYGAGVEAGGGTDAAALLINVFLIRAERIRN